MNVFKLGATFLKLCRVLNLTLPHVDPSLYISRFAVALDFGDYTQRVAQDAVRIAQRMDRDWITSGRRPAGICGACLLIAARMNGFRRTTREMIYVVKVADITIQKRLQEFNQTESAQLSVRDFRTIWLEKRADPPSFAKNRKVHEDQEASKSPELADSSTATTPSLDEQEEDRPTSGKRKHHIDELPEKRQSIDKEKTKADDSNGISGPPSKKRKGKGRVKSYIEASSSQGEDNIVNDVTDIELDGDESEGEPLSDDEVDGPFVGKQVGISAADNCIPESKAAELNKKKTSESTEKDTEKQLIKMQIENSLNEEIKQLAKVDVPLTAEANLKSKDDVEYDDESTQVGTQVSQLESTQTLDIEELGSTLVNKDQHDFIPINDPHYESLPTDEKAALTAMAKAKVAKEVSDLLNPDLEEDAKALANDMESWLGDESVKKAATEIGKQL